MAVCGLCAVSIKISPCPPGRNPGAVYKKKTFRVMGACEMGKRTKMIRVGLLCVINFLAQLLPSYLYILFRIHPKSWWCCLCVCVKSPARTISFLGVQIKFFFRGEEDASP